MERAWSHDGRGRLSSESVPGLAAGIAHAYARAQPGGLARHDVTMPDGATSGLWPGPLRQPLPGMDRGRARPERRGVEPT